LGQLGDSGGLGGKIETATKDLLQTVATRAQELAEDPEVQPVIDPRLAQLRDALKTK
jgi:hypothetical protein